MNSINQIQKLINDLNARSAGIILKSDLNSRYPVIQTSKENLLSLLGQLNETLELKFDFLECITGLDTNQDIEVIYQLLSADFTFRLNVKVIIERHQLDLPSVCSIWAGASYFELELMEMLGLRFIDHPSPKALLLPEDWVGHPLRKDYSFPEFYHGVEHRRVHSRLEHERP